MFFLKYVFITLPLQLDLIKSLCLFDLFPFSRFLLLSSSNDKERSRSESRIQRFKMLLRVALLQDRAPNWLWYKAAQDVTLKRNETARGKEVLTPYEKDSGVKPDWSRHVGFYARGVYHIAEPLRFDDI